VDYKLKTPVSGNIGPEKYRCTIHWRNGEIVADEDTSIGGKNAGPDPVSLLLSSIASSVLIMLRIYIDNKGWDIPSVSVNVNMYEDQDNGKMISFIDRDIVFHTPVEEEKKTKLLEIAANCPLTQLLNSGVKNRTFICRDGETRKMVHYGNEKLTVVWKPEYCQHSTRCWKQLPEVFNPQLKKWINIDGAEAEKIIEQVRNCPSGALTVRSIKN
jgi:putative redox protein